METWEDTIYVAGLPTDVTEQRCERPACLVVRGARWMDEICLVPESRRRAGRSDAVQKSDSPRERGIGAVGMRVGGEPSSSGTMGADGAMCESRCLCVDTW